jgi:hypothetical protein
MVVSPKGLGPEDDCAGQSQQKSYTTDPSSRQRERPKSTIPQLSDNNKNLVVSPRWVLYSKIHSPIDRRSQYKTQTQRERERERQTDRESPCRRHTWWAGEPRF